MKHLSIAMPALLLAALAASPAQAVRDPFARPALPPSPAAVAAAAAAAAETAAAAEPVVPPRLRAIMVLRDGALANINGRILGVGEWFGDYQVVTIRERSVTLAARGGAKTELALDQAANK
jgi:hypothetical protein